jgi:hypothetical protein
MVERLNIPNSPACGQWETLLAEALDGLLRPEDEAIFTNHMATCASCTEMFEQAKRGREWLEFLSPEPEVPAGLFDKILAGTGHGKIDTTRLAIAGGDSLPGNVVPIIPAWQRPGLAARFRRFAEPRLLMTAAMAFFSIGLTLSMTGVHISSIKMADLRPATVRSQLEKRIATASTPIIRYYDHLRFVYEMESTMRQIRQSRETDQQSQPSGNPKGQDSSPNGQTKRKDGGSNLNPKDAPQQTVNPPENLWSAQTQEAALETERPLEPGSQTFRGFSKHSEASVSLDEPVLATPERSKPCLA